MKNSNMTPSPIAPARAQAVVTNPADVFGLGPALEAQVLVWNQVVDANRSLLLLCTPWLQTAPLWWSKEGARTPVAEDTSLESAETADGVPDAFEVQARSWNRFLDMQRTFWTSVGWPPVPGAGWAAPASGGRQTDGEARDEPTPRPAAQAKHKPRPSRSR